MIRCQLSKHCMKSYIRVSFDMLDCITFTSCRMQTHWKGHYWLTYWGFVQAAIKYPPSQTCRSMQRASAAHLPPALTGNCLPLYSGLAEFHSSGAICL